MKADQTAVVLIEFQNEFCKEGGKLFGDVRDEIVRQDTLNNAVRLLHTARKKGCLVIHCPFVFDETWVQQHAVCGIIGDAAKVGTFREGQWGTQFIEELAPAESEPILSGKHALSGFKNTQLGELLEQNAVRNVVIAGFLSNVCVEATARSAYDLGYRVSVVRDATAAMSQANQQYVEREIYPLLGGSITVDQFIERLLPGQASQDDG